MNDFLAMGGYGSFVWASYALAAAVLGWNIHSALAARRDARAKAERNLLIAAADSSKRRTEAEIS
jgi:hypothetical protein